jgi:hypothetical protein
MRDIGKRKLAERTWDMPANVCGFLDRLVIPLSLKGR